MNEVNSRRTNYRNNDYENRNDDDFVTLAIWYMVLSTVLDDGIDVSAYADELQNIDTEAIAGLSLPETFNIDALAVDNISSLDIDVSVDSISSIDISSSDFSSSSSYSSCGGSSSSCGGGCGGG